MLLRKLIYGLFFLLCVLGILWSLLWMLPRRPAPDTDGRAASLGAASVPAPREEDAPSLPAFVRQALPPRESVPAYYLCDEGGRLTVYLCRDDGSPASLWEKTDIYVNLLPESDALRIKQGYAVQGEQQLQALLEDLGR